MLNDINDFLQKIGDFFVNNGVTILFVILIFILGFFAIKYFCKLIMAIIYATKIDNAIGGFFVSILKIGLWLALLFGIASLLGIKGSSFLVAFSSVALAVGLALKDSLANIANGIVIIMIKPFKKGDHVSVEGVEGIIKNIRILTTELTTFDNKKIVLPNSKIVNSSVVNYTSNPTRRIDATFSVSYQEDMAKVKAVLNDTLKNFSYALQTPLPSIYLSSHNDSSIDFTLKFWVNTIDYWNALHGLPEVVFMAFKENDIKIPYPQLDVHFDSNAGDVNEKK